MLHRDVEHIAMKYPGELAVAQWQQHFVDDTQRAHFKTNKASQHLIVVAGDVTNLRAFAYEAH